MYFIIGIILVLLFFAAIGRSQRKSNSYNQGSSSEVISKNQAQVIDKTIGICNALAIEIYGNDAPFISSIHMEELEKIYCSDPYEFETELIGKSFFFMEDVIDINKDFNGCYYITIGSNKRLGVTGSERCIIDKANVYIEDSVAGMYLPTIKIGDELGVIGQLVKADDYGFIIKLAVPILINASIHPLTEKLVKFN